MKRVDTDTSLAIMAKAAQMLAEATTIQQAKELRNLALTAKDWARRKGLGEEAIQHCRQYALLAERKMGEMLIAERDRLNKGSRGTAKGRVSGGRIVLRPEKDTAPTLADLGLTKRQSSEAQALAKLPERAFQEVVAGKVPVAKAIRQVKKAAEPDGNGRAAEPAPEPTDEERVRHLLGPMKMAINSFLDERPHLSGAVALELRVFAKAIQ